MKPEAKPFFVMFIIAALTMALMFYSYRKHIINAEPELQEATAEAAK